MAPLTEGIVFFSKSVTVFNLTIYNSLLLLPQSLSKLAKAFGVSGKLDFDVFENDNADLFNTDFREKLLEYNKQDCKVLYDVILAFNNIFKDLFKLSTLESSTLPSLAYKLFSKTFLKHELELTFSERYVDYKEAYRGGAVDVYRPHGYNLFCYDVNSLYPYVMQSKPYPVGYSEYFWGNILSLSEIFGIVKCNIIAPDIYAPILLTKTVDDKVIAPIGSWTGWYCSEELKLAQRYGYQIEVIEGYHWSNQEIIFSEYVNKLYDLRLTYPKSDSRNFICKLLLNSLYGKFGMSPIVTEYSFTTEETFDQDIKEDIIERLDYKDIVKLGKYIMLGQESTNNSLEVLKRCQENKKRYNLLQISTPIAVFTTAYARMHMAELKIKYKDHIYYSDTDSFFMDIPLPDSMVGDELGKFKLEYDIQEAVFLAPKVYALRLEDGTEVIKVKGSKNKNISFDQFKFLLNKGESLEIRQDKWFKSLDQASINILDTAYTLRATQNKRNFIYSEQGLIVGSTPIILNNYIPIPSTKDKIWINILRG